MVRGACRSHTLSLLSESFLPVVITLVTALDFEYLKSALFWCYKVKECMKPIFFSNDEMRRIINIMKTIGAIGVIRKPVDYIVFLVLK